MIKNDIRDLQLPREKLNGIYRGVVEDNKDDVENDIQAGRCKIRVFGIHSPNRIKDDMDGIPTNELPWAEPACPIFGGVSNIGIFGVPCQGAHVFLFFENGNILQPRYFATAPGIPWERPDKNAGFNDPDGIYPSYNFLPDWNDGSSPERTYPNSFIIEDTAGNSVEMDSTPGHETVIIKHCTGSNITITETGKIQINDLSNTYEQIAPGNYNITTGGDTNITTIGDHNLTTGEYTQTVLGSCQSLVNGGKTETVTSTRSMGAGSTTITSDGDFSSMAGGATDIISSNTITIKSKEATGGVLIQSNLTTVQLKALLEISALSISFDVKAILASMTGVITQTKGYAINIVSGGIVMIG